MSGRALIKLSSALIGLPLIAAYAGGWATITVENLPDYVVAGQPTNITFSVRQHGWRLMDEVNPSIEASSGKVDVEAHAVATNKPGYYTATLKAPQAGEWKVKINSGWGASNVKLLPIVAVGSNARPVAYTPVDQGHRLYVAKGCLTCHVHGRVEESGRVPVGPDLTARRLPREYLERFLADPSIKAAASGDRGMPNLNLKPAEIASLVAFINQTASVSMRE
jgi:mono/diheme cytochrome c family protein